jgi:hypothetical protein
MTVLVRGAVVESAAFPASGKQSHAEGTGTATGLNSHAEGTDTQSTNTSAHAEGQNGTASGTYSHCEGINGTASGASGSHAEGSSTIASGISSHAEGDACTASSTASHAEGASTTASGLYSHSQGKESKATRHGQHAQSGTKISVVGDAQISAFVATQITTNATPATLTFDGAVVALTGSGTNVLTIPVSRGHRFRIEAVARRTDGGTAAYAGWTITGTIVRDASGNARILGTPVTVTDSDAAASTWTLAVSVNTTDATNNYLQITATGEAAKTIRWVAAIYTTEVG